MYFTFPEARGGLWKVISQMFSLSHLKRANYIVFTLTWVSWQEEKHHVIWNKEILTGSAVIAAATLQGHCLQACNSFLFLTKPCLELLPLSPQGTLTFKNLKVWFHSANSVIQLPCEVRLGSPSLWRKYLTIRCGLASLKWWFKTIIE